MAAARSVWRRWLRWDRGRQGTGYDKLLLLENHVLLPFDGYLLRYPAGSSVPPHRDRVQGGRHFRLNIVLKRSPGGGEFVCERPLYRSARVNLFRSDLSEHAVTRVEGGSRYVLSIGWVLRSRV